MLWPSGYSPASHRGVTGSIPESSTLDFWTTKCQWDRFLCERSDCPLPVSSHQCSTPIFIYMFLLPDRRRREDREPFKKVIFFPKSESSGEESNLTESLKNWSHDCKVFWRTRLSSVEFGTSLIREWSDMKISKLKGGNTKLQPQLNFYHLYLLLWAR